MNTRTFLSPRDRIRSALCAAGMVASAGFILWMVLGGPAKAQTVCGSWAEIRKFAKDRFHEESVSVGTAGKSTIVVLASESGTFTIVIVTPSGMACPLAVGTDWQTKPERGF